MTKENYSMIGRFALVLTAFLSGTLAEPRTSAAGPTPVLTAGSDTVHVGDVFAIPISIANTAGLTSFRFDLAFDPTIITALSFTDSGTDFDLAASSGGGFLTGITGFRLEALTDPSLPGKGPGRGNGNFVLTEFKVMAAPEKDPKKAAKVLFSKAVADFSQEGLNVLGAIDEEPFSGWGIAPQMGKPHIAVFEAKQPINIAGGVTLMITLDHQFTFAKQHNLGKFRISATTAKAPLSLDGPPDSIIAILDTLAAKRTKEQQAELAAYYRSFDPELKKLSQALAEHSKPPADKRLLGAQDLAWALINSPAFLFNH